MQTCEANRLAVGDAAKAVRDALCSLGYARSLRWVYRQCEPSTDVKRLDFYGAFWRWFLAIWHANRQGAEFLFEDFRSRVLALREQDELRESDWYKEVARCESEHSEAIQAAILNRDDAALRKELPEAIAAYRKLLAIVEARGARGFDCESGPRITQTSSCEPARSTCAARSV
jgi:hypothetical protein